LSITLFTRKKLFFGQENPLNEIAVFIRGRGGRQDDDTGRFRRRQKSFGRCIGFIERIAGMI